MVNMGADNELYNVAEHLRVDEDQLDLLAEVLSRQGDIEIPADPAENPGLMRKIAREFRVLCEEQGDECGVDDADSEPKESYANEGFLQAVRQYVGPRGYGSE